MGLRETMRELFNMKGAPSREELARLASRAAADVESGRTELESLEAEAARVTIASGLDDSVIAKAERKVTEQRTEVARLEDRHRRLQAAFAAKREQEDADAVAALHRRIKAACEGVTAACRTTDESARLHGANLASAAGAARTLHEVLGELPRRLHDMPEILTPALAWLAFIRLYAAAGALAYGDKRGMSRGEAQAYRTLEALAKEAEARIMAQLKPQIDPTPEAA